MTHCVLGNHQRALVPNGVFGFKGEIQQLHSCDTGSLEHDTIGVGEVETTLTNTI